MVTDYDVWHPEHDAVTVEAVLKVLQGNVRLSQKIVAEAVEQIGDGFVSPAHSALATAITTDRAYIPPEAKERLKVIAGKYL